MGLFIKYSSSILVIASVLVLLYRAFMEQGFFNQNHKENPKANIFLKISIAVLLFQTVVFFSGFVMHLQKYGKVNFFEIEKIWIFGDTHISYTYELFISTIGKLIGSYLLAGMVTSTISIIITSYFIYMIVKLDFSDEVACNSVKYFLIFPFTFCLYLPLSDSLFLALTISAFYYMRKHVWFGASVLMFFSILCDLRGIFLVLPMIYEIVMQKHEPIEGYLSLLFAPLGLGTAYILEKQYFLSYKPNSFNFIKFIFENNLTVRYQVMPLLILLALVLIGCIYFLGKFRTSYLLYALPLSFVPFFTTLINNSPRLFTAVFPIFIGLGFLSKNRIVDFILSYIIVILLGFYLFCFINWHISF